MKSIHYCHFEMIKQKAMKLLHVFNIFDIAIIINLLNLKYHNYHHRIKYCISLINSPIKSVNLHDIKIYCLPFIIVGFCKSFYTIMKFCNFKFCNFRYRTKFKIYLYFIFLFSHCKLKYKKEASIE